MKYIFVDIATGTLFLSDYDGSSAYCKKVMLTNNPTHDLARLQADLDTTCTYDENIDVDDPNNIWKAYEDYKVQVSQWAESVRQPN